MCLYLYYYKSLDMNRECRREERVGQLELEDMLCHEKMGMREEKVSKPGKPKKKNNNRRKREKLRERKKEAEQQLEGLIARIYRLETTFRNSQGEIDNCLSYSRNEDRFYEFINNAIRDQVEVLARGIHQCTKAICTLETEQEACSPGLAAELYGKIQTVSEASPEIEQIINLFIMKNEEEPELYSHKLDLSTLKYIFDSDKHKEPFEKVCERQLARSTDTRYKMLIEDILRCMHRADTYSQSELSDSEDEYFSSLEEEAELQHLKELQMMECKYGPNKKKKKTRKDHEPEDLSLPGVMHRLQSLVIRQDARFKCSVSEKWVDALAHKYL